jgi:hypothetical protein
MKLMRIVAMVLAFVCVAGWPSVSNTGLSAAPREQTHGPEKGSLVIDGGQEPLLPVIARRFVALAGGPEANIIHNTFIIPHVIQMQWENRMAEGMAIQPGLLGIGVDAGAALVVHGNQCEVIGASKVLLPNGSGPDDKGYEALSPGARFDLAQAMKAANDRLTAAAPSASATAIMTSQAVQDLTRNPEGDDSKVTGRVKVPPIGAKQPQNAVIHP